MASRADERASHPSTVDLVAVGVSRPGLAASSLHPIPHSPPAGQAFGDMASTAPPTQVDVLDQLFQGLKSKSSEVRAQSALELQRYVCPKYLLPLVSLHRIDLQHYSRALF